MSAVTARTPALAFLRTMIQTRNRRHNAIAAVCYRFALAAATSSGDRFWDYTARTGIGASGCALPADAAPEWADPLEWARRIEATERRKDSRLFRDDVIAVPHELVAAGKTQEAVAKYADKLATVHRTPFHWVLHDLGGWNVHAHVCYAARRLTGDGAAFSAKVDRDQNKHEMVDDHKALWTEVCAGYGLALDFDGPQSANPFGHLGPRAWAVEKQALAKEMARDMAAAMEEADAAVPEDPGEHKHYLRDLEETARALVDTMTVAEVLALDREPVTDAARAAKRPRETYKADRVRREGRNTAPTPWNRRPRRKPTPRQELAAAFAEKKQASAAVRKAELVLASARTKAAIADIAAGLWSGEKQEVHTPHAVSEENVWGEQEEQGSRPDPRGEHTTEEKQPEEAVPATAPTQLAAVLGGQGPTAAEIADAIAYLETGPALADEVSQAIQDRLAGEGKTEDELAERWMDPATAPVVSPDSARVAAKATRRIADRVAGVAYGRDPAGHAWRGPPPVALFPEENEEDRKAARTRSMEIALAAWAKQAAGWIARVTHAVLPDEIAWWRKHGPDAPSPKRTASLGRGRDRGGGIE